MPQNQSRFVLSAFSSASQVQVKCKPSAKQAAPEYTQIRAFYAVKCKKCKTFFLYIEKYNTALHCTAHPYIYHYIFFHSDILFLALFALDRDYASKCVLFHSAFSSALSALSAKLDFSQKVRKSERKCLTSAQK